MTTHYVLRSNPAVPILPGACSIGEYKIKYLCMQDSDYWFSLPMFCAPALLPSSLSRTATRSAT